MNSIILFLIIIIILPIFNSTFSTPSEEFISSLDNRYYYNDEDCIFNSSCQLSPNNINFYKHKVPLKTNVYKLNCNLSNNKLINCSNDLRKGCYVNKSCNPNFETFVGVTNSPGENSGKNYPNCPQGFHQYKGKRCKQFCRNCLTGVCEEGLCSSV